MSMIHKRFVWRKFLENFIRVTEASFGNKFKIWREAMTCLNKTLSINCLENVWVRGRRKLQLFGVEGIEESINSNSLIFLMDSMTFQDNNSFHLSSLQQLSRPSVMFHCPHRKTFPVLWRLLLRALSLNIPWDSH